MTEHLPECWAKHDSDPEAWCICDELRSCEQRVLDAAREAVVVLCWRKQYEAFVSTVDPQRVLAAIDALKESK